MNTRQLKKLGVPDDCVKDALKAIQTASADRAFRGAKVKQRIKNVLNRPEDHTDDEVFGPFAEAVIASRAYVPPQPVAYRTWGAEGIDEGSFAQMEQACSLPVATGAALMPDAHIGYGLPIGGVLACDNAVIPYAVGVDIACRMKLSVLDVPVPSLDERSKFNRFKESLEGGTRFGVGVEYKHPKNHAVMDRDWSITRITREKKDLAWRQLGTSGSGNHFAEFGLLTLPEDELGLPAGQYVALLSHSGSRGTGYAVCSTYSGIARSRLSKRHGDAGRLAWLDLDSEAGREYWAAMTLMGEYASANHNILHREVTKRLGAEVIGGVENHHNFAWKEKHGGREVIVHRKGATPAGKDVLGVIPGSMATPAFVVRGLGNADSLSSAAHGAGRVMSRKKAKQQYQWRAVRGNLEKQGVRVLSADADEVPNVYKDIEDVMARQADLVRTVGRFDPRIVKMCGDGSRPED